LSAKRFPRVEVPIHTLQLGQEFYLYIGYNNSLKKGKLVYKSSGNAAAILEPSLRVQHISTETPVFPLAMPQRFSRNPKRFPRYKRFPREEQR